MRTDCRAGASGRRAWFVIVAAALTAGLLLACADGDTAARQASEPDAAAGPRLPSVANPFGVMSGWGARAREHFDAFAALGTAYYRPLSVNLAEGGVCGEECRVARAAGLRLVISVQANGGMAGEPSVPPADLEQYRADLGAMLERERPVLLVVGNEQDSRLFHDGTPAEYLAELQAACEVAHELDIPCADGGITSAGIALLVLQDYWDQGLPEQAIDFAQHVLPYLRLPAADDLAGLERLLTQAADEIAKRRALVAGYQAAGADFTNFHWYVGDGRALAAAVDYLRRAGGLEVITNEIGQRSDDPAQTLAEAGAAKALGLPLIIWFSADTPGGARSLVNPDGSLRPAGEGFRQLVLEP